LSPRATDTRLACVDVADLRNPELVMIAVVVVLVLNAPYALTPRAPAASVIVATSSARS
jgi:hypothetical protein